MGINWRWEPRKIEAGRLIELARQAAAARPEQPKLWMTLANLLARSNEDRAALDALTAGIESCPDSAGLRYMAAVRLRGLGAFAQALDRCNEALQLDPRFADAQRLQFALEVQTRDLDAAGGHLADAAAVDPCEPSIFRFLGKRLDEEGVAEELLERCETALAVNPGCANAAFFKALVLAKLSRADEATAALSLDRYVEVSAPDIPSGFGDRDAFLGELAAAIRSHPTLRSDPAGKATMSGMQTGALRRDDGPAISAMVEIIRRAVEGYASKLRASGAWFAAAVPAACSLDVWGVVLGAEGRQRPHRHPGGWLSGVFYVTAPRSGPDERYSGALMIGAIKEKYGLTPPWGIREIEPVPGRLVLFPSYTPHATSPSGLSGDRISVAFDVNPAA